jgi:hypothetical protein
MAHLHVDVDLEDGKKNMMKSVDKQVLLEDILPSLEIVSGNGIVTLSSCKTCQTRQESGSSGTETKQSEEEEEEEEEYHIDISQLDDRGLQAIRSNLDELFSEFDTRGKGELEWSGCYY